MRPRRHFLPLVVSLVVVPLATAPLDGGEIDPKAQAIVQKVAERLSKADAFTVDISISTTEQHRGSNLTLKTIHELSVSKPDKIAFLTKAGTFGTTVLLQGCNEIYVELPALTFRGITFTGNDMGITFISNGAKAYVSTPYMLGRPKNETSRITDVDDESDLASFFFLYDIAPYASHGASASMIIQDVFLVSSPEQKVLDNATRLRYLGREKVRGEECHKVEYCFPKDNESHLFVPVADAALLREIRSTYSHEDEGVHLRVTNSTVFQNWSVGQPLAPDQFEPDRGVTTKPEAPPANGSMKRQR